MRGIGLDHRRSVDLLQRRELFKPLIAAALASSCPPMGLAAQDIAAEFQAAPLGATVTDRIFLDIRIIQRYDVAVLEDAAIRGRLTINLFGKDAPLGTQKFLDFIDGTTGQFKQSGSGPSYAASAFDRLRPGIVIEGGKINGLRQTTFAGQQEYEYMSRLIPLRPVIEANNLRHTQRGLLTRPIFSPGPEFGVTLAPSPALDGTHEVIGQLDVKDADNTKLLELLENLPYITGKSLEGEGTAANAIFETQKKFFTALSKSVGDTRAEDRTGLLLRRVEITRCGRL